MSGTRPVLVDADDALAVSRELSDLWRHTVGRAPSSLVEDLKALGRFFEPWRQPAKLRGMLAELGPFEPSAGLAGDWYIKVGSSAIITPEGRVALERLTTLRDADQPASVDMAGGGREPLLDAYRQWSQRTLRKVIRDLTGEGELMYVRSIAAVALVMAAGADSPETALTVESDEPAIAAALNAPVEALAERLEQRAVGPKDRLAGYPLSRARQRLGQAVQSRRPAQGAMTAWVPAQARTDVIAVLADEMLLRLEGDRRAAQSAVIGLFAAIDEGFPALAAAGLIAGADHRRPTRDSIVGAIERCAAPALAA